MHHPCTKVTKSTSKSEVARAQHRLESVTSNGSKASSAQSSSQLKPQSSRCGDSKMTRNSDGPIGFKEKYFDSPLDEGEDECNVLSEVISKLTALTAKNFNSLRSGTLVEAGRLDAAETLSKLGAAGSLPGQR